MADSPFSVGSGKPTISRVPERGGGAFRPRPVFAPASAKPAPVSAQAPAAEASTPPPEGGEGLQEPTSAQDESQALWARLAAVEARCKTLKVRAAQWSQEGMKSHG